MFKLYKHERGMIEVANEAETIEYAKSVILKTTPGKSWPESESEVTPVPSLEITERQIGQPVSRADALIIATHIGERAERERLETAEEEAQQGIDPPVPLGRIAAVEHLANKLKARANNHEQADVKRKRALEKLDEDMQHVRLQLDQAFQRLDALEHRLDHFTPLLAGETGKLETVVACLECNQNDTNQFQEQESKRLDDMERRVTGKAEAPIQATTCPKCGESILVGAPAEPTPIAAPITLKSFRGVMKPDPSPRDHRDQAFWDALTEGFSCGCKPVHRFQVIARCLRENTTFEFLADWLDRLADALRASPVKQA